MGCKLRWCVVTVCIFFTIGSRACQSLASSFNTSFLGILFACILELYSCCQLAPKHKDFKFIVPVKYLGGQTQGKFFIFFILNLEGMRVEKSRK